jgi:hypothetical protein
MLVNFPMTYYIAWTLDAEYQLLVLPRNVGTPT